MKTKSAYEKKVTSEEARAGYFLVLKSHISFFPSASKSFTLVHHGRSRKARLESYACNCRGPDEPHRHFFIRSKGLGVGDQVVIRKDSGGAPRYLLVVHRKRSL